MFHEFASGLTQQWRRTRRDRSQWGWGQEIIRSQVIGEQSGHSAHRACSTIQSRLIYFSHSTPFSCLPPATFGALTNQDPSNLRFINAQRLGLHRCQWQIHHTLAKEIPHLHSRGTSRPLVLPPPSNPPTFFVIDAISLSKNCLRTGHLNAVTMNSLSNPKLQLIRI